MVFSTSMIRHVVTIVCAALLYSKKFYALFLFIFTCCYCTSQYLLGAFLTWLFTNIIFHGHPLVFGPTFLRIWLDSESLKVSLETEKVVLGNPPGFVHREFIATGHLKLGLSMSFKSIKSIFDVCWNAVAMRCHLFAMLWRVFELLFCCVLISY